MSKAFLARAIGAALLLWVLTGVLQPAAIQASHSWASHWRRPSSAMFEVPTRRMLSSIWLTRFATAMADWRKPAMKKIRPKHTSSTGQNASCPLFMNTMSVCNGNYGAVPWAGLAQVWSSGGHTVYGRAVQNDYYMTGTQAVAYRQMVICQEIGHVLGLGHINVSFNTPNVGSCMDYTNDPDGGPGGVSNTDPDNMNPYAHDYAQINSRYSHIGMIPQIIPGLKQDVMPAAMATINPLKVEDFGALVARGDAGHTERYLRDYGNGWTVTTWVTKHPR